MLSWISMAFAIRNRLNLELHHLKRYNRRPPLSFFYIPFSRNDVVNWSMPTDGFGLPIRHRRRICTYTSSPAACRAQSLSKYMASECKRSTMDKLAYILDWPGGVSLQVMTLEMDS